MQAIIHLFFLPRKFFERFSNRAWTLFAGILLVGLADILPQLLFDPQIQDTQNLFQKLLLWGCALLLIVIVGVVDVFFFALPLYETFGLLRMVPKPLTNEGLIRGAKCYALTHVIIFPMNMAMTWMSFHIAQVEGWSPWVLNTIALFIQLLFPLWFYGLITRGMSVIYQFGRLKMLLTLLLILSWNALLNNAFEFAYKFWINPLLAVIGG